MFSKVTICGRLTEDVQLRESVNKIAFVRFRVAVNNIRSVNTPPTYVDCTAWRNIAINMSKFLKKGSLILVEGNLRSDNRQNLEVLADFVYFLESKQQQQQKKEQQPTTNIQTTTIGTNTTNPTQEQKPVHHQPTSATANTTSLNNLDQKLGDNLDTEKEEGIDWNAE